MPRAKKRGGVLKDKTAKSGIRRVGRLIRGAVRLGAERGKSQKGNIIIAVTSVDLKKSARRYYEKMSKPIPDFLRDKDSS